jgi:hypothetical protein
MELESIKQSILEKTMINSNALINVYMNSVGLWTASLFEEGVEIDTLGGSYPKSNNAVSDSSRKWGRDVRVSITYSKLVGEEESLLEI